VSSVMGVVPPMFSPCLNPVLTNSVFFEARQSFIVADFILGPGGVARVSSSGTAPKGRPTSMKNQTDMFPAYCFLSRTTQYTSHCYFAVALGGEADGRL
jgi:hypothetical protein